MSINPELMKLARYSLTRQKQAFQPPQDPAAGGGAPPGAPPMDPSMMGGAGGMPPMDPSMMGGGGAPPMDPSMGGGGAPPMDPSMMGAGGGGAPVPGAGGLTADTIRQIMQETMGQMGMQPGGAAGAGGMNGKANKDQQAQAMSNDIFQIKKMMSTLFNSMGIPLPQDILDGPNRDPATGMPMPPGAPGSTSDPSRVSPPAGGGQPPGPDSSIKPIGPIQGAFPAAGGGEGGGGEKKSYYTGIGESLTSPANIDPKKVRNKAAALNAVLRRKLRK